MNKKTGKGRGQERSNKIVIRVERKKENVSKYINCYGRQKKDF
jgi:hypothetical protein